MIRFLEHRIADQRMLRLIRKWLKAGVIEDGEWKASEEGCPQGSSISYQPAAAQTDSVTGLSRGSPVQVAAAVLVVLGDVRGHIQLPYGAPKILTVIRLGSSH